MAKDEDEYTRALFMQESMLAQRNMTAEERREVYDGGLANQGTARHRLATPEVHQRGCAFQGCEAFAMSESAYCANHHVTCRECGLKTDALGQHMVDAHGWWKAGPWSAEECDQIGCDARAEGLDRYALPACKEHITRDFSPTQPTKDP